MIESLGLASAAQAASVVGLILLEAIVLYVGYGYVEDWTGPRIIETIRKA